MHWKKKKKHSGVNQDLVCLFPLIIQVDKDAVS